MGWLKKVVDHPVFNSVMNVIIILSIIFILFEKLIDFNPYVYNMLSNLDVVILAIFAVDFILRFIAGGKKYFIHEYGWIDLLAVLPIINPAVKGLRMIRLIRTLRILRVLRVIRILKVMKTVHSSQNPGKEKYQLAISSLLMLLLILSGGVILLYVENILRIHDLKKETTIMEIASTKENSLLKREYLQSQPEVIKVYSIRELNAEDHFLTSLFIKGDTYSHRMDGLYIIFSRKESRRTASILEAIMVMGIFAITLVVLIVSSVLFDRYSADNLRSFAPSYGENEKVPRQIKEPGIRG